MQKWELAARYASVGSFGSVSPARIWLDKDKKTGKTDWDMLSDLASQGWELVSVTPLNSGGYTMYVMYTFKRPVEDE